MTKGRSTTQSELAEIVAFCLEYNKDYLLAVETYNVSYQQVYANTRRAVLKGYVTIAAEPSQ